MMDSGVGFEGMLSTSRPVVSWLGRNVVYPADNPWLLLPNSYAFMMTLCTTTRIMDHAWESVGRALGLCAMGSAR